MKRFLLFTMFCASLLIVNAQTITWTGAGDGTNWSDSNNWDLLHVPTYSNDVIIPEGDILTGGNILVINEHVYAKSINLQSNNTLDIYNNISFKDESLFDYFSTINWYQGDINSGETGSDAQISTVVNRGYIVVRSAAASLGYCVLVNEGGIEILSSGALHLLTRSELKNQTYGIIDLHNASDILPMIPIPGYYTIGEINNYGTIKRSPDGQSADIMVPVNNYGTIEAILGDINFINFDLNNTVDGIIKGTKAIKLPKTADFINNGIIKPGSSPGSLTFIGDFTSSDTSKLKVDLEGYNQGGDYDLLAIQGDAIFDGVVDITMGFEGSINDEFIVATTTGTITQCNLEPTAFAAYGGNIYEFNVACQNNKEVVLKLMNVEPGPTVIWTGNGDGINWHDPYNWDLLAVPTIDNDVIVRGGSTVTINEHVQTKSLKVQGNIVLTLNDGISFSKPSFFGKNVTINWHLGAFANYWPNYGVPLTNKGTININRLIPSFNAPQFYGPTFNNEGVVNLINGSLVLVESVVNNQATGIIDIQSDDSGIGGGIDGNGTINNYGIVKKTIGTGDSRICSTIENLGSIEVLIGELYFCDNSGISFNNSTEGSIKGIGAFNASQLAGFSNSGTFEPGSSPGTLTVIIDEFTTTSTSKLAVDLNGLKQGSEYDLLVVDGNPYFLNGSVNITLGFEPLIDDEFVVLTTTGYISQCNLTPVATAEYNGNLYEFSVACRNNNELVLTLTNITLGVESHELTAKNILLFPNPVSNVFNFRNNSNQELISATIIDVSGRVVKNIDLHEKKKDQLISMHNFATGLYLIKINSEDKSIVKKIVKI